MKSMDLWRSKITVSWYLAFFSLVIYATLIIAILLAPWSSGQSLLWISLLVVTLILAVMTQKRLFSKQSELVLCQRNGLMLMLDLDEWLIKQQPFILSSMIFFKLTSPTGNKSRYLILAYDNMSRQAWHGLNYILLQHFSVK